MVLNENAENVNKTSAKLLTMDFMTIYSLR